MGLEFYNEHLSTVGYEKMESKIISDDGETIILRIWDTAGQERFRSISSNTIKNADACIIVFDLTNKNSFKCVENWIK